MPFYLRKLMAHGGYLDTATSGDGSDGGAGGGGGGAGDGNPAGGAVSGGDGGQKTTISDNEAALLREVMDKKNKLKTLNEQYEQVNARLKEFEGLNATEIRQLVNERKTAEQRKLEEQGNWDALKKQMLESHDAAIAAERSSAAALKSQLDALQSTVAELTVGNAFSASKFVQEKLTLPVSKARAIFGTHFEFDQAAGKVVGFDKPNGAAGRTQLVDGRGDPLAFEEAISKLVELDSDRDRLLKTTMKQGAGSRTDSAGGAPKQGVEMTGLGKIAAGLKNLK